MAALAAKLGDRIVATDIHTVNGVGPQLFPFDGGISQPVSPNVTIDGEAAAVVGSMAANQSPHAPPPTGFQALPSNLGRIVAGSGTVFINGKSAARDGDRALTCSEPDTTPIGRVEVRRLSRVFIG